MSLVSRIPNAAIGVDTLVGFPGETEAFFENTYALIDELPIMYLHVFPFSARPGTPAAIFPDPVPPDIMKARTERLRALGTRKKEAFLKKLEGQTVEVLVEARRDRKTGLLKGMSPNYATVMFDGPDTLFNTLQPVTVDTCEAAHVTGRLESVTPV
jgi:threonylcarbamoyladenosine tRNA methylthiotransferase MtaB